MKTKLLALLLVCLLLCGCQAQTADPDAVHFDECASVPMEDVTEVPLFDNERIPNYGSYSNYIPTGMGVFLLRWLGEDSETTFLYYDDFATGEIYPICAKTNCTHDSYDCNAYLPQAEHLYFDGTHIYYFVEMQTQLWRMNPDGTDREIVFQLAQEPAGLPMIWQAFYAERKVCFLFYGMMNNPETGAVESDEYICIGDLDTGEVTQVPVRFPSSGSSSLNLVGYYDGMIAGKHVLNLSLSPFGQRDQITYFLLDAETGEVTVLYQYEEDYSEMDRSAPSYRAALADQGIYIFHIYDTANQPAVHTDRSEAWYIQGTRIFVDLAQGKAYRMADQDDLSTNEKNLDGRWLHKPWNQDHTAIDYVLTDLSTGESEIFPFGQLSWQLQGTAGDYYLIFDYAIDGSPRYGKILKEDYWSGNHDAICYYPDWVWF